MAYRYGDRRQAMLFPQSIDEYVPQEAPVRAYDAFVDALDFEELGIEMDGHKVGCPQYDPKAMLKLLIYGYSYGIRSSRKLEREAHYNLSFIWLIGGLQPHRHPASRLSRSTRGILDMMVRGIVIYVPLGRFYHTGGLSRRNEGRCIGPRGLFA